MNETTSPNSIATTATVESIPQVVPIPGGGQLITVGNVQSLYTTKLAKVTTTDGKTTKTVYNVNITTNLEFCLPAMPWRVHELANGIKTVLWNPAWVSEGLSDSRWAPGGIEEMKMKAKGVGTGQ